MDNTMTPDDLISDFFLKIEENKYLKSENERMKEGNVQIEKDFSLLTKVYQRETNEIKEKLREKERANDKLIMEIAELKIKNKEIEKIQEEKENLSNKFSSLLFKLTLTERYIYI